LNDLFYGLLHKISVAFLFEHSIKLYLIETFRI
jgi:hypothetical protein